MKHSRLYTDEAPVYEHIGRRFFSHESVNHTKGEYARGTVNTNSAEGFFGILRRGITGVYHHVGKGHLNKYVDEFSFRYNSRTVTDGRRARDAGAGRSREAPDLQTASLSGLPENKNCNSAQGPAGTGKEAVGPRF